MVAFDGGGLIRGVAFDGGGLIRGVAFDWRSYKRGGYCALDHRCESSSQTSDADCICRCKSNHCMMLYFEKLYGSTFQTSKSEDLPLTRVNSKEVIR